MIPMIPVSGPKSRRALCLLKAAAAVLFTALASAPSHAQVPRQPASTPVAKLFRIAGTLTDSISGAPVTGATLKLSYGRPRQTVQTVVTDEQGRFALDPVAAGKYSLRASRRGYMAAEFDQHDDYSSAIVTGEGQDTEHLPFHLSPEAMIRGQVTDADGEPVEGAQVLLMRKTRNGGLGEHLVKSISGGTDDTGLFEFWNLLPGTYFMAVKASPWYALHPGSSGTLSEEQHAAVAPLDVAYPVTYFDSSYDEASATPIPIASGDHVEANVTLHAVPAVRLTVHVPETTPDQRYGSMPTVKQTIFGEEDFGNVGQMQSGPPGSGVIEIAGVPPGRYSMSVGDPPRVTEVDTTASQDADLTSGTPTFGVDIRARMADGSPPPQQLELDLTLISDVSMQRQLAARLNSKGTAQFESLASGVWNVMAKSNDLALAVVAIQSGTQLKAGSRVTVNNRPLSLTVTIAQGKTEIDGFAFKDGKGHAGEMIVLVPRNPEANLAEFRRDQSDSDGSFALRDVVPGDYTIVAIDNGWDLAWARSEVISPYVAGGTAVHVPEAAGPLIRLNAPIPAQPLISR